MSRKLECTVTYQTGIEIYDQISILRNQSEVNFVVHFRQSWARPKQLGPLQKLACMFLYQTSIQMYDQISTPRIWSKVKLHHSILLRFGLKEGKMAEKLETNATFQTLVLPSLPKVQNSSKSSKSLYAWLSLKWLPKFSFKFQLQERRKNNISQTFT